MISTPKMESLANIYILEWKQEGLCVKIDRLVERSDGVTGEALITKGGHHLFHGRLNLLSTHSKQALNNVLGNRINNIDWQAVIEQTCVNVLREYRKGEPVVKLGTLPPRTTPRYRLYPFILENERTILYGFGGSGKSKMAQFWGLLVQCGIESLDLRPIQGNVLILDWETSHYAVDEWIAAVKAGMGIECEDEPIYRYCTRGLADDIVEIQRIIMDNDIKLVIVDSVGMAIGGDAESQDMTRQYFGALRSLRIASLSIDHKAKKGKGIYGSVYKTNIARSTFELRGHQESGASSMDIGIYHRKANDTRIIKPSGFHIDFVGDEDRTEEATITKRDIADVPELEEGLSQRQRIMTLLKNGAMSAKDISEALGTSEVQARVILNRNKKVFVKNDKGDWGLLSSYAE